jgi:Na+-translocating ferredoxin:NAD+ oxidoreductase RnfC subunit
VKDLQLLERIWEAGIVGAGGAGFPTHKKLVKGANLLLINAAECEPLLSSDRFVMRHFSRQIVDALCHIRQELSIPRVVIGTKAKYTQEIAALQQAIDERGADIEIHRSGSYYPAGDEQILIYEVTGQTVPPGGIPLELGIVVSNITTIWHIHQALQGNAVTEKYITVTGAVAHPVILRVPVGTPVADCIAAAGGVTVPEYIVIKGGPMMGRQYPAAQLEDLHISKSDGGLVVLEKGHYLDVFSHMPLEHIINQAKSVCIQCSYCTELCPRYLIGHKMRPHRVMRSIATGAQVSDLEDALLCCECGICELYACPMHLSPRRVNIYIKNLLRQGGAKVRDKTVDLRHSHMREFRQIEQGRLIQRLDLLPYPRQVLELGKCQPASVSIALRHGIGKEAHPIVAVGDSVKKGQCIATVDFADVGSNLHASIDGTVTSVDGCIQILADGGNGQ